MAGWGSNNKYSMLGAMRAIAQMVSYELPLIITTLPVVMVVGSLSPDAIVNAQGGYSLGFTGGRIICIGAFKFSARTDYLTECRRSDSAERFS